MGKAEKNKSNSITAQWAIPTIILMVFLVFTLISYNKTMQENSKIKALYLTSSNTNGFRCKGRPFLAKRAAGRTLLP